jgi:hypothetical protein
MADSNRWARMHRRTDAPRGRLVVAALAALACVGASGPLAAQSAAAGNLSFTTYRLANGLTVVLAPNRTTPIVTVNVWYHGGSASERVWRSGFAHLF